MSTPNEQLTGGSHPPANERGAREAVVPPIPVPPTCLPKPPAAPPAIAAARLSSAAIPAPPLPPARYIPQSQPPQGASANRKVWMEFDISPRRKPRRWWWRRKALVPTTATEQLAHEEQQRRRMPSWLASFVVHLVLLLILACIPIGQMASAPLTLIFGESGPDSISEFELTGLESPELSELFENTVSLTAAPPTPSELLRVELPVLVTSHPETPLESTVLNDGSFNIGAELAGRKGSSKSNLLKKFGGNAQTEEAVELGLKWLAKQQKSNGSWSLTGPYASGGAAENTTAATAMALNAFLGAGYTHKEGKYVENVKLGLAYLLRRQDKDGFFSDREPSRQQMYAQAIATITVVEAYGLSGDSELRIAASNAIRFAEWSQSNLHGWRYNPREDADLSVTGWFLMALETGRMVGLAIDPKVHDSVTEFLDNVSHEEQTRYAYSEFEPPSLSMTAEGLLCRIYLGWPKTHPALLKAIHDDLLPNVPRADERDYSVYYWYYATQVLHHVGGTAWKEWNAAMRSVLPALQEKAGGEAGSWDPRKDAFGASGGRLYTTCFNLYCLEVYYRHLSVYDLK